MKKIIIVFGTRPEAIKLCPLILELLQNKDEFKTIVCVTGQHREMLDSVLKVFDIKPDYDLNIMKKNQTLYDITATALIDTGKIIEKENPDMIIVQGDTTTTFATTLAAFYNKINVGHVEAGLRTKNKYSPFPEEINRRLTTHIADIHFAPTNKSKQNLVAEGIPEKNIIITGNTVIDALLWVRGKIQHENRTYNDLKDINFSKRIILVTGHRRENFGVSFLNVFEALKEIALNNSGIEIVYPVHLNPHVNEPAYKILSGIANIKLLKPIDYEPFIYLMDKCYLIISDSGGIQEEAPSLGKPVLVTRNNTERPEALETGSTKLIGTNKEDIIIQTQRLINNYEAYQRMSVSFNPFGDGHACKRIVESLALYLNV